MLQTRVFNFRGPYNPSFFYLVFTFLLSVRPKPEQKQRYSYYKDDPKLHILHPTQQQLYLIYPEHTKRKHPITSTSSNNLYVFKFLTRS